MTRSFGQPIRLPPLLLLAGVAACALPSVVAVWFGAVDSVTATLIACGIALCVYPTVRYIQVRSPEAPLLPIVGLIFGSYFVLPALFGNSTNPRFVGLPADSYTYALSLAIAGIGCTITGTYVTRAALRRHRFEPILDPTWSDSRATSLAIVVALAGLAAAILNDIHRALPALGTIATFTSQLPVLAISVLFYLQLKGRLGRGLTLFLWCALVPCEFAIDISSSLIYSAFRDGFVLLAIYLIARHRFPWRAALLAVLFAFPFLAFKPQYRQDLASGYYTGSDPLSYAVDYVTLVVNQSPTLLQPQVSIAAVQNVVDRLDNRSLLAYVVYHTPLDVPYWSGGSYVDGLWKFVPRAIVPTKPGEDIGQEFGHRYGLLDYTDLSTSWNLPQVVELYANFGVLGVLLGMLAIGVLYALIQLLLEGDGRSEWAPIFAMFIYSSLFSVDGNFTLVFGGTLYSFILLYILTRFILRPQPTQEALNARGASAPLMSRASRTTD